MTRFSGMGYLLAGTLFAANALFATRAMGADLTLYADDDYQGRALGVVIDERTLGVLNFDKRASSVVVENSAWILCTGEEYTGQCITLEPGRPRYGLEPQPGTPDGPHVAPRVVEPDAPLVLSMDLSWPA